MTRAKSTSTLTPGSVAAVGAAVRRSLEGPLLVAADDTETTSGPLRLAELLARRDRVAVRVLGVVRPVGLPVWLSIEVDTVALEEGRRRQHVDRLRSRVHQTVGLSGLFDVEVVSGSPAPTLAKAARESRVELVLVGLADLGSSERSTSEDSVLQIARVVHVPVLAVPGGHSHLFADALAAVDFSESSLRAVRAAVQLLAPGATLTLAHVEPVADLRALGREGWAEIYERGVAELFESLATELRAAGDITVKTVLLEGEPVPALLDYAATHGSDLVASGTQGVAAHGPCMTGSVSTALLRGARAAVLIAPPTATV